MPDPRYQCTARDLATPDPETRSASATVESTETWLRTNGYDVAPIVDDETPVGYVALEALLDAPPDDPIDDHAETISLEQLISVDATFDEILIALYKSPFYFLGGQNRVTGILTRADINKPPATIHLFDRISLLETRFRDLIETRAPDWKTNVPIDPDIIDDIEDRHRKAQDANLELGEIHYAQFSTLVTIISETEACWQACGFGSAHRAGSQLDDLQQLRNAVAHSNRVLENTNDGLLEAGRTIGKLQQTYQTLDACLTELDTPAST
jgi:hypothetical protein